MVERLRAKGLLGEMAAEFAGTMILILFGVAVVAQVVAGGLGGHDSIAWGWGFGVTLGIYVGRADQRRAPESGGDHRAGRVQGFRMAEGGAPTRWPSSWARSWPR